MRYFDTHSGVISWSSEEIKIPYVRPDDGRNHLYYPDFLAIVQSSQGPRKLLIEVKPAKQTRAPKTPKTKSQHKRFLKETVDFAINTAKWNAAEAWCKRQGIEFLILTEHEILGQTK